MRAAVLFLPVVAAVQVIDSQQALDVNGDYDGMKATLKAIAARQSEGEKISESVIQTVHMMLNMVRGKLMETLNCDRDTSQASLDQAVAQIQACDDNRDAWFRDVEPGHANTAKGRCDFHNGCRMIEENRCTTRNNLCDAQDLRVKAINDGMCPVPDFSLGDGGKGTVVNDFMNCLATLVTSKVNAYQSGRHACRQACVDLAQATAAANVAQGTCEDKTCAHEKAVQDACCEYRTCRKTWEENYYSVRGIVRQEESVFQTQREGLQCLLCYGYGITNATENYDQCESPDPCDTYDDCPKIDYPEKNPPVDFKQCTEAAPNLPCEQAWKEAMYPNFLGDPISRHHCVPKATTCTECAARPAEDTCGGEQHKTDSGCNVEA